MLKDKKAKRQKKRDTNYKMSDWNRNWCGSRH